MKRVLNRPAVFVCLVLLSAAGCAKKDLVKKDEMVAPAAVTNQAESTSSKPAQPDDGSLADRQAKEMPAPTEDQSKNSMDSIYFNFDSADLDSAARDSLAATYRYLNQKSGLSVRIEGNCDERGSAEYNLALGEASP